MISAVGKGRADGPVDNLLPAVWGAIGHGFQHFSLRSVKGYKRTPFVVRRGLTRGTGHGEKRPRRGGGVALVDPI